MSSPFVALAALVVADRSAQESGGVVGLVLGGRARLDCAHRLAMEMLWSGA